MRSITLAGLCVMALASCGQTQQGEPATSAPSGGGAISVTTTSLSPTRSNPPEDQYIECVSKTAAGNTTRHFFIIYAGGLKSYSSFRNYARDLCDPGQPDCAMGWQGDKIGSYSRNGNGVVNQLLVDLDSMTMERAVTTATRGVEISQAICTASPLPEGIVID
ncbi:hypothetical protein [Erythrobacter donghaensis]|uniref:hypothetical protein n=1 Tax=Erythrobacter donghaensis TaxID=267135 RepID=UPI0011803BEA|nr:hypothetical protein [Erythrobacter donghaensis]